MMSKKFRLAALLFIPLFVMCGKDKPDLYQASTGTDNENSGNISGLVTIADLKRMYNGMPTPVRHDIHIFGRVISSDEWGNVYKSLYVEDATGGIEIRLDRTDLFRVYMKWFNVRVNCNSLVIDSYGGALQLGMKGTDILIPPVMQPSVITLSPNSWAEVLPREITIDGISAKYMNCFVRFNDVQFADQEVGNMWTDEGETTERLVVDRNGNSIVVRTSGHADFAHHQIPTGSGFIQGILTYFNGKYQILMNDRNDVVMESERFGYQTVVSR